MQHFIQFCREEAGTTAIEYALIAVLVSIAAIASMVNIGSQVMALFGSILPGFLTR